MKNPWVVVGVITLVLFGGAVWFSNTASEKNNIGIEDVAHIKGNPNAAVKMVEFSDLQCPACASFQPVLQQIMDEYGDDLSLEFKHFPLPMHPHAMAAAMATEAAGQQDKFFEFHDILFERQQEWSSAAVPGVYFAQYAEELELDVEQFKQHSRATALRDKIQSHAAEARTREVSGTPTFFLNGQKMQFQTFEEFVMQIALAVDPSLASTSPSAVEGGGVRFGI